MTAFVAVLLAVRAVCVVGLTAVEGDDFMHGGGYA
jgi:hypothetical protein